MNGPALSIDALASAVGALPDGRLAAARKNAFEQLVREGIPGTREEDWKYTDLSTLAGITNAWLEAGAPRVPAPDVTLPAGLDADWIVIANGRISAPADLPPGVTVDRLGEAVSDLKASGRLGALNTALLHDGARIRVADGVTLERPLGLLITDHVDGANLVSQARIDIEVGRESAARFVEYEVSAGDGELYSNIVVNLTLAAAARADLVRLQARAAHHSQTAWHGVEVGRDARFSAATFDVGGRLVRNDLVVRLGAPGAEAVFGGLYLVGDGQHVDNHTRVDHLVGPATSRQEYRGILAGKARGVWNGKAIVHEGADGTDAEQANHNLLLSRQAEIDAKPELEIYADDVKCSHGTTVGQLDEKALFYLRSRGLDVGEARQMLTRAFAMTIVGLNPIDAVEPLLLDAIDGRLRDLLREAGT